MQSLHIQQEMGYTSHSLFSRPRPGGGAYMWRPYLTLLCLPKQPWASSLGNRPPASPPWFKYTEVATYHCLEGYTTDGIENNTNSTHTQSRPLIRNIKKGGLDWVWVLVFHPPLWTPPLAAFATGGGRGGLRRPHTAVEYIKADGKLSPILNEDHFFNYPN